MEPIKINATELRNHTHDLMERVKYHGDIFLVETFGRPMAVIVSVEVFQKTQSSSRRSATKKSRLIAKNLGSTYKKGSAKKQTDLKYSVPLSISESET